METIGSLPAAGLLDALHDVAAVLSFRALPVVACLVAERPPRRRVGVRAAVAVVYAAASVGLRLWTPSAAAWLAASYAYFLAAGCALPLVARAVRAGTLTHGAALVASTTAFLVVPALILPRAAKATALAVGWDVVLSSYSYAIEVSRAAIDPPLRACLFFLFVNPALVYSDRGRRFGAASFDARGLRRSLGGLATMVVAAAVLTPACAAVGRLAHDPPGRPLLALAVFGALRLSLEYARQAGLASLQIGLLRQIGYEVPERFRRPLAAVDPLDFWRRWNTYVTGWLRRYVFWPVALRLRGSGRPRELALAGAAGVAGAFVAAGLLHDAFMYALAFELDGEALRAFAAVGALVVLWAVAARAAKALAQRWELRGPVRAAPVLSRAALWVLAVGCVAWGWR